MKRRLMLGSLLLVAGVPLAHALAPSEKARIDSLIDYVASRKDVTFVRNGKAYSNTDAAKFLRGKMEKMGEHVNNAQQFIDEIASKSSTTGQPYLIRFADGRTEPSAKFLGDQLRRIDVAK
jgi:hypothetical protein